MNRGEPLLAVKDLAVAYPRTGRDFWGGTKDRIVIRNVSFDIGKRETFGLVGESGSGKTTVAMSVLRYVRPFRGYISFKGMDLWAMSGENLRRVRRQIQPVFQNAGLSLNPRMTVGKAVEDGLGGRPSMDGTEKREKVLRLLRAVELGSEHIHRYPHQLSTGQKQRVCLARALAPEPDLLVLDEPLSGQDVSLQAYLIHLLSRLKTEMGLTYLLISHDWRIIRTLADRVGEMRDGTLLPEQQTGNR